MIGEKKLATAISYMLMGLCSFTLAEAATSNSVETYDFKAPFKDYNNKIVLNINNVSSAKMVEFTSNFKPKAGWGNCFGTRADLVDFVSTQSSNGDYVTKMTLKDGGSFDLTQSCDIMGTDSGNAIVLPGVVVPLVNDLKIDGKNLEIERPCAGNICKDPAPGYTNSAYYAQWAVWGRKYNPYDFKYNKLNTIIYAFIGFDKDTGNIKTLDASADTWGLSAAARAAKKYPYLKSFLSFGGWTNNGVTTAPMFEQLASNQQSMETFAKQSVGLMRKLGFNGIDIDWEWWSDYGNDVAPAKKMLAFFKVLRAKLDKAGKEDGKKYYLAIAVNGARSRIEAMEDPNNPNRVSDFWKQTGELMDEINVMNYDYQGAWGAGFPAYFQASATFPDVSQYSANRYNAGKVSGDVQDNVTDSASSGVSLSESIGKAGGWSIHDSIDAYIKAGVPAKKLIVGLPLYARSMAVDSDVNGGLFQVITGSGLGDYENGVFDYKCLVNPVSDPVTGCGTSKPVNGLSDLQFYNEKSNLDIFDKYGKVAMQPWAYSPSTKSFITYDDAWSVAKKTEFAMGRGLGGTMFWQADGDSTDDGKSLISAVAAVYQSDSIYVSVDNVTETSATISWNKPELDGNVTYIVKLNGNIIAQNISVQNYILTNLDKATNYNIEVIANALGESREDKLSFTTASGNDQNQTDDVATSNWDPDKAYTKGEKIEVNGVVYEAQWWTKGENPTQSGEWGVWREFDNQTNDQGDDTSSSSGTWSTKTVYSKGDQVTYNGQIYTAQWWTQGDIPSNGGAWEKPVIPGGAWESGIAYTSGQTVTLDGNTYKAKWWTSDDNPKDGGVWQKL
ncbi:glycosyl hydrolase family 18 protein [Francisella halioticida]|nr:glycosyl hydrolase family 18 protein [Francisella halioticida]